MSLPILTTEWDLHAANVTDGRAERSNCSYVPQPRESAVAVSKIQKLAMQRWFARATPLSTLRQLIPTSCESRRPHFEFGRKRRFRCNSDRRRHNRSPTPAAVRLIHRAITWAAFSIQIAKQCALWSRRWHQVLGSDAALEYRSQIAIAARLLSLTP